LQNGEQVLLPERGRWMQNDNVNASEEEILQIQPPMFGYLQNTKGEEMTKQTKKQRALQKVTNQ
jgi:hypothetical protein